MVARAYIRHPSDMPIELVALSENSQSEDSSLDGAVSQAHDVSLGGLSFSSPEPLEVGAIVNVRIPVVSPAFEARARVIWCISRPDRYEAGIEFVDVEDAYRARMVEQICHIEHYRLWVEEVEGRSLDTEMAAQEWIGKYASDFPNIT
jgi:PilZ domain